MTYLEKSQVDEDEPIDPKVKPINRKSELVMAALKGDEDAKIELGWDEREEAGCKNQF